MTLAVLLAVGSIVLALLVMPLGPEAEAMVESVERKALPPQPRCATCRRPRAELSLYCTACGRLQGPCVAILALLCALALLLCTLLMSGS